MAIIVNGHEFRTLAQPIYLGATQVLEAYCNGVKVYPDKWPVAIKIVKPPDKTDYVAGEEIDYTGIVVQLLDEDGEVYRDSRYPDGIIPFEELEFPVEKASGELTPVPGTYNQYATDTFMFWYPGAASNWLFWGKTEGDARIVALNNVRYYDGAYGHESLYLHSFTRYNDETGFGKIGLAGFNGNPDSTPSEPIEAAVPGGRYTSSIGETFAYLWGNGRGNGFGGGVFGDSVYGDIVWVDYDPTVDGNEVDFAFRCAYGDLAKKGGYEVPVNWRSRYEDRTLTDTFEITIENSTSSGGGDF